MRNDRTDKTPLGGSTKKPEPKMAPFPGLIDDNRWTVKESNYPVYIDRSDLEGKGGFMHVPFVDDERARKMRLQEQAHVKYTPNVNPYSIPGVHGDTVQACEDGRVIQYTNRKRSEWRRINTHVQVLPEESFDRFGEEFRKLAQRLAGQLDEDARTMRIIDAARLLAMSRGYIEGVRLDSITESLGLSWIRDLVNHLHGEFLGSKQVPEFADTVDYARELERACEELEEQLKRQRQEFEDSDIPGGDIPEPIEDDALWGQMNIEKAPLTEALRADKTRRQRPHDQGAVPRYMHRLLSDQRVFGRRRKEKHFQGTVLIDHSGSMNLSADQVDAILRRWPAVTIATYSGRSADGVLRIVAKNGRRAAQEFLERPSGTNNLVDGPALDWLAKQKGPRVWISDGGVTGVGGSSMGLRLDAARKVNAGKIKRIPNVQDLLDA